MRLPLRPLPRLPRLLGAYLFAVGAAGLGGIALALRELTLADASLSIACFALPLVAGWQLWRRGWAAWRWGLASQIPQLIEVATGTRLFRVVIGVYCTVALAGTPPQTGWGFSIGVSTPAPQADLGRWVSLDLFALTLAVTFLVASGGANRHSSQPSNTGGG